VPMAPTVVFGGLALWRVDWPRWVRGICVALALAPVIAVGGQIARDFGVSFHTVAGVTGLVAVYAALVWACRPTMSRSLHVLAFKGGGRRYVALAVGAAAVALFMLQIGLSG